jgi:hypothetical protein
MANLSWLLDPQSSALNVPQRQSASFSLSPPVALLPLPDSMSGPQPGPPRQQQSPTFQQQQQQHPVPVLPSTAAPNQQVRSCGTGTVQHLLHVSRHDCTNNISSPQLHSDCVQKRVRAGSDNGGSSATKPSKRPNLVVSARQREITVSQLVAFVKEECGVGFSVNLAQSQYGDQLQTQVGRTTNT